MFGVARHTDVHQIGAMIAILIRVCRHLTGRTISSIAVQTVHRISDRKSKLEKLLGGTIKDGAGFDEIRLPIASWDLPIVSADPYLHRVCVKSCEEALARRVMKPSRLKVRVENAIATLLPHVRRVKERWPDDWPPSVRPSPWCLRTRVRRLLIVILLIARWRFHKSPGSSGTRT
jgi:hypothetical protein